ncbi:hypothetical protein FOPG_18624 [Fusarium oxysporum f. sp. conglutinans race 2 54008]|uniref:Uncharacterized protein n=2 Tax=Fusarium oxysporum TaxID=5507 RepID=X0KF54_FUSOX|nr:hypothetical protein FOPG_18624 [Fusarium oxysporum f. sp. conglutinans race 2 54008]EXM12234.1 hypothetical protein FOTG_19265 [Fusarium oxysporum f. sp. vasinfectum 25433]
MVGFIRILSMTGRPMLSVVQLVRLRNFRSRKSKRMAFRLLNPVNLSKSCAITATTGIKTSSTGLLLLVPMEELRLQPITAMQI